MYDFSADSGQFTSFVVSIQVMLNTCSSTRWPRNSCLSFALHANPSNFRSLFLKSSAIKFKAWHFNISITFASITSLSIHLLQLGDTWFPHFTVFSEQYFPFQVHSPLQRFGLLPNPRVHISHVATSWFPQFTIGYLQLVLSSFPHCDKGILFFFNAVTAFALILSPIL